MWAILDRVVNFPWADLNETRKQDSARCGEEASKAEWKV